MFEGQSVEPASIWASAWSKSSMMSSESKQMSTKIGIIEIKMKIRIEIEIEIDTIENQN